MDKHCDTNSVYIRVCHSFAVHINYVERLLIQHELGAIDSVHSEIPAFYFNDNFNPIEEARAAYFGLRWPPIIRKETNQRTLATFAEGYLHAAMVYAQRGLIQKTLPSHQTSC